MGTLTSHRQRLLAILFAGCLAFPCSFALPLGLGLGIQAAVPKKVVFDDITTLNIELSQPAEITLTACPEIPFELPEGHLLLTFTNTSDYVMNGITLNVYNPKARVVRGLVEFPPLSAESRQLIAQQSTLELRLLQTDLLQQWFSSFENISYNANSGVVTANLPNAGYFFVVLAPADAPEYGLFGQPKLLAGNQQVTIQYPGGLSLVNYNSPFDNELIVVAKPFTLRDSARAPGLEPVIFYDLRWQQGNFTFDTQLSYQYNTEDLNATEVAADSLSFFFYNLTSNEWEPIASENNAEASLLTATINTISEISVQGTSTRTANQNSAAHLGSSTVFLLFALLTSVFANTGGAFVSPV